MLSADIREKLLGLARNSIAAKFDGKDPEFAPVPEVSEIQGAFVTLHIDGMLRGCIGNIVGRQHLWKTVRDMAREAAFGDPRFPALSQEELDSVDIEISVMSELSRVSGPEDIEIGKHGIIISRGMYQAVFLPQVPVEQGWDRDTTLGQLCLKAGLALEDWRNPGMEFHVFTAEVFGEKG